MSKTLEIQTSEPIDANDLYHYLQHRIENIVGIQKSETGFYFYKDQYSTRGIDFFKEDYGYEVRVTALSNAADYEILNEIIRYFLHFRRDAKYMLDDEPIKDILHFDFQQGGFSEDASVISTLVNHHQSEVTLYGPKGEYYIGPKVLKNINTETADWEKRLEDLILKIQYHLPESESDNVLSMGDGENQKILKVVSRKVNYILKKYDYLIFHQTENENSVENMVIVTNEIVNQNLPKNWELIDDFTIVAPSLTNEDYQELVTRLLPFDRKAELGINV